VVIVLVALGSAVAYGASDFLAGLASRRGPVLRATTVTYAVGVVLLGLVVAAVPGVWSAASVGVGAVAGLIAVVGFVAFYAALAAGPMGVLSPVIAMLQAAVPVAAGLLFGERLGLTGWAGVGAALLATALLGSAEVGPGEVGPGEVGPGEVGPGEVGPGEVGPGEVGPGARRPRWTTRAAVLTLVAGVALGLSVVALDRAPADSGLAPAWIELVAGLVVLLVLAALARRWRPAAALAAMLDGSSADPDPDPDPDAASSSSSARTSALRLAVGAGALLAAAQGLLMAALHGGELVVVAVLVGLYPLATVLLARIALNERLTRRALVGVAAAVTAGVLLAWA